MMFTVIFSWQVAVFVLFSALSVRLCGGASSHRGVYFVLTSCSGRSIAG